MFAQESQRDSASQETLVWKHWITKNEELDREGHSLVVMDDKILIVGGSSPGTYSNRRNLILMNPKNENLKIVESHIKDEDSHGWINISACYWKENKIIVHGGLDSKAKIYSTVAIVTLKDLDSENPSAYWEKVETQTQLHRKEHFTYIYNDKMYAFGGTHKGVQSQEMWCLDLNTFAWSQIEFEGWHMEITVKYPRNIPIFHENKAYIIPFNPFVNNLDFTIHELDLNSKTCRDIKVPSQPRTDSEHYMFCPRIINGGLYIHRGHKELGKLWFYDLKKTSSQQWVSIETKSCPNNSSAKAMWCNNQLVDFGCEQFWSLQLPSLPEKKKQSSIPANITKTQQTMKNFLTEAPYSDISFEVESKITPAHKWWLCKKSKYFANMFSSNWLYLNYSSISKGGMSEAQASKIKITDMKATTFQAFLEFLYSDHVELDNVLALELLQQADKYSIPQLVKECEAYLAKNLTPENYVAVAEIAEILEMVPLREAAVSFIAKNVKELKKGKDFGKISDSVLRDSIVKFIVK